MAIHHALIKQGEKLGFSLEFAGDGGTVRAFMASKGQQIFGASAKDAVNQMIAFQNILKRNPDARFQGIGKSIVGILRDAETGFVTTNDPTTPVQLYRDYDHLQWVDPTKATVKVVDTIEETLDDEDDNYEMHSPSEGEPGYRAPLPDSEPTTDGSPASSETFVEDGEPKPPVSTTPMIQRSEKGVPLDGAIAYAEGIMAGDNPFEEGSEEGDAWDSQWDQAADGSSDDDEEKKGGSVVASRYRTRYKEEGHPNHCGDWLANLLNNFCVGDKKTDLDTFEKICYLNGVDTSAYNRTTPGWQGRIRMTGRNKLARVIFGAKKITVPTVETESGMQDITAPADWIAAQRFNKPKAE